MTTRCSICRHPARADIDAALAGGTAVSTVARQYQIHRSSVDRHKNTHLVAALARVVDRDNDLSKDAILNKAAQLYGYCEALLERAEDIVRRHPNRPRAITTTSAVIRETRATLTMVADTIAATTADDTEPQPQPIDLRERIVSELRKQKIIWELADGTVEYSEPCPNCGYRPTPTGPLRHPEDLHPQAPPQQPAP
jgi:hypothetical protein